MNLPTETRNNNRRKKFVRQKDDDVSDAKKIENIADDKACVRETGGPKGLEPTRYGDWELNGRCTDF